MRERVGVRVDLFFMSSEIRKRIETRVGLFFTSLEMKERVWVRVDLFFRPGWVFFSRDSFFMTLACYNDNRKSTGG